MAAHHQNDHHTNGGSSDLTVGMTGLGLGLALILVVAAFSYWLAV